MSAKFDENVFFVQANRKLDKRKIFIKSTVKLDAWVEQCDILVDCEFVLTKISEEVFLTAVDKSNYIYYVTPDNYLRFKNFIETNYDKIKKPQ